MKVVIITLTFVTSITIQNKPDVSILDVIMFYNKNSDKEEIQKRFVV